MKRHVLLNCKDMGILHMEEDVHRPGGLDFPAHVIGQTANCQVMAATQLGQQGITNAQKVLAKIEGDYQQLKTIFGGLQTAQMVCIVAPIDGRMDGSAGAYHYSCADTTFYCDADYANPDVTLAVFAAEAIEVWEALQAKGWNCGGSNGEGLSRTLAELLHPGILDPYNTAGAWLDSSRQNWVDATDPTDQNPISTGCAVLFLWWLNVVKGFGWDKIAQAGSPTLGGTYTLLTGKADGWTAFSNDCQAKWPVGTPSGVKVDNPWGNPGHGGNGGNGGGNGGNGGTTNQIVVDILMSDATEGRYSLVPGLTPSGPCLSVPPGVTITEGDWTFVPYKEVSGEDGGD